ncbi:MAG: aminodeoxychorismate synthase component I [Chlamydiales bacterium]|nr:aminodeoxychorismate synthase component I [Chlamydiales bacterium]
MMSTRFTTTWKSEIQAPCALLLSGNTYDSARRSFLCRHPIEEIVISGERAEHRSHKGVKKLEGVNPWEALKRLITLTRDDAVPEWVGYFAYEMGAFADYDRPMPYIGGNLPDARFVRYANVIEYDHHDDHEKEYVRSAVTEILPYDERTSVTDSLTCIRQLANRQDYKNNIEAAKELIRLGEVYQVNLSQQVICQGSYDPAAFFIKLHEHNPAPFSAYLNYGTQVVVSSSPERFLSCTGGTLETRPIKGTMPRGVTPEEDRQNMHQLLRSEKERSELLMITDLMRNDLAKISIPGTVATEKIWQCEAYTNVFHLLSIITSVLEPSVHPVDAVRSCFPAGSITGCPKLRSMEVIAAIEKRRRGIYTGAIGYFAGNGDFDFNVAIRTLSCSRDQVDLQLGGAVVIDSDPDKEYDETLYKGESLFKALGCCI